jgi:hypothetical protein
MSKIVINQEATFVSDGDQIVDTLRELSDTAISSPATDEILIYNGSQWTNGANTINNLEEVTVSSPANGEALIYNSGTSQWENQAFSGGGASALNDLSDVTVSGPADGELLVYNSATSQWENTLDIDGGTF